MTESQLKQNAYNNARKKKIIESIKAIEADDLCAWAESVFSSTFETPAEHIKSEADKFHKDIVPF